MSKPSRRRFLQTAAVGAAAVPLLGAATAHAGDPAPTADASLTAIIRQRFKHLTEAQIKSVQTGVQRGLAMAEILKRSPLEPVDEPSTIFVADIAE